MNMVTIVVVTMNMITGQSFTQSSVVPDMNTCEIIASVITTNPLNLEQKHQPWQFKATCKEQVI